MDPGNSSSDVEVYRLLMIGDAGVGKSGLLMRFTEGIFGDTYNSTIGVDFKVRTLDIDGKCIKLQIWDTSGQERFRAITANYYRNIQGIIVVYDITRQKSFDNVEHWLDEIERNITETVSKILVGNKSDLRQQATVASSAARSYANYAQMPFIETSVKTGNNVDNAFITLAREIKERLSKEETVLKEATIRLTSSTREKKRRKCCKKTS